MKNIIEPKPKPTKKKTKSGQTKLKKKTLFS